MEIKCKFENLQWDHIAPETAYSCTVTCKIKSRGPILFEGKHEDGKDNHSVVGLWFKASKVHYLPRNLVEIFPNLAFIDIKGCELKELSADDLAGMKKLKVFWAPDNEVTTLPLDLFRNTPELTRISFSKNLITKFQFRVLEPIKGTIELIQILNNPGINEQYERKDDKIDDLIERITAEIEKENGKIFAVLIKRIENLFTTGKHSDFTIKVRDQEYKVHKCILASQSSVFDKMFSDDEEESTKTFNKIGNFSQEAFAEFLHYFYSKIIPHGSAIDLLELAVEFDVPDLKSECETIINQSINQKNSLEIFNLAVKHSLPELKRAAFEVIKNCHSEIGEFSFDIPTLVNEIIKAKVAFQAKQEIKEEK